MVLEQHFRSSNSQSPNSRSSLWQLQTPLSRLERFVKGVLLGGAIAPLIGALFYASGKQMSGLGCPILALTGVPCPSCGMTRAFTALVQGHFDQAIAYHLLSPAIFIGFAIAALHLGIEQVTQQHLQTPIAQIMANPNVWIALGVIFFGYYVIRLYHLMQTGEFMPGLAIAPIDSILFA